MLITSHWVTVMSTVSSRQINQRATGILSAFTLLKTPSLLSARAPDHFNYLVLTLFFCIFSSLFPLFLVYFSGIPNPEETLSASADTNPERTNSAIRKPEGKKNQ